MKITKWFLRNPRKATACRVLVFLAAGLRAKQKTRPSKTYKMRFANTLRQPSRFQKVRRYARSKSQCNRAEAFRRQPLRAVRALEKAGCKIVNQGKHIVMSDGSRILTIPRHNPVNEYTMGGIVRDAGLTVEKFKKLL